MNHNKNYIYLLMNTLSPDDFKKECERLKYILGAHPKPKRTDKTQAYTEYISNNIYKGNTGFDLMCKRFKIKTNNQTCEFWEQKTGLTKEQLQKHVDETAAEAKKLIESKYKELNSVLNTML